eukprot:g14931.t1
MRAKKQWLDARDADLEARKKRKMVEQAEQQLLRAKLKSHQQQAAGVRKQRKGRNNIFKVERRLATWTSRVVDGKKQTFYVSLEGREFAKGDRGCYRQQKLDFATLKRHGISAQKPDQSSRIDFSVQAQRHGKRNIFYELFPEAAREAMEPADVELRTTAFAPPERERDTTRTTTTTGTSPSSTATKARACQLLPYYHVPRSVCEKYAEEHGIEKLYEWQADCLSTPDVLRYGRNLVYTAPTSGGKSLVADLLMMRRLLYEGKRAMKGLCFLALTPLPFVSICNEKVQSLQAIWGHVCRVGGFFGPQQDGNWYPGIDVAVCTYEKANGLISRWIEENTFHVNIGTLVVDELHMVREADRGYILELILTKVRLYQKKMLLFNSKGAGGATAMIRHPSSSSCAPSTKSSEANRLQIIGLSATLPSLDVVASWLDAALYRTTFRPVQLDYKIKLGAAFYCFSAENLHAFKEARRKHQELVQLQLELDDEEQEQTTETFKMAAEQLQRGGRGVENAVEVASSCFQQPAVAVDVELNLDKEMVPKSGCGQSRGEIAVADLIRSITSSGSDESQDYVVNTAGVDEVELLAQMVAQVRKYEGELAAAQKRQQDELLEHKNKVEAEDAGVVGAELIQNRPQQQVQEAALGSSSSSSVDNKGFEAIPIGIVFSPPPPPSGTIPFGVAYHHAGLLTEERAIIEAAFREKTLLVLCCTTTLAAGVNLPCRRVLLRSLKTGPTTIDLARFLQIVGRAGRAGLDSKGECVVWCEKKELQKVTELFVGDLPELESSLTGKRLRRALLETVALGLVESVARDFVPCTLRGHLVEWIMSAADTKGSSAAGSTSPDDPQRALQQQTTIRNREEVVKTARYYADMRKRRKQLLEKAQQNAVGGAHAGSAGGANVGPAGGDLFSRLIALCACSEENLQKQFQEHRRKELLLKTRVDSDGSSLGSSDHLDGEQEQSTASKQLQLNAREAYQLDLQENIEELLALDFFRWVPVAQRLVACPLGEAAAFASLETKPARLLYQELAETRKHGIVLSEWLHCVYLCTPLSAGLEICDKVNWDVYLIKAWVFSTSNPKLFARFDADQSRIAKEHIGVRREFIQERCEEKRLFRGGPDFEKDLKKRAAAFVDEDRYLVDVEVEGDEEGRGEHEQGASARGRAAAAGRMKNAHEQCEEHPPFDSDKSGSSKHRARVFLERIRRKRENDFALELLRHLRFFCAMILFSLLREMELPQVMKRFGVPRDTVQNLQTNAGMYCGVIVAFCERLRWWPLKAVFEQLAPRMHFGVPPELQPLLQIGISGPRARALADDGWTLEKIARVEDEEKLVRAFVKHDQYVATQAASGKGGCTRTAAAATSSAAYRFHTLRKLCKLLIQEAQNKLTAIKQEVYDERLVSNRSPGCGLFMTDTSGGANSRNASKHPPIKIKMERDEKSLAIEAALKNEIEAQKKCIAMLEQKVTSLSTDFDANAQARYDAEHDLAQARAEVESGDVAKEMLVDLGKKVRELSLELDHVRAEKERARADLEKERGLSARLRQQLQHAEAASGDADSEWKQTVDQLVQENIRLETDLGGTKEKLVALEQDFVALAASSGSLSTELEREREEREDADAKLLLLEEEAQDREKKLKEQIRTLTADKARCMAMLRKYEAGIAAKSSSSGNGGQKAQSQNYSYSKMNNLENWQFEDGAPEMEDAGGVEAHQAEVEQLPDDQGHVSSDDEGATLVPMEAG